MKFLSAVCVLASVLLLTAGSLAQTPSSLTPSETARFLAGYKTGKLSEENSVNAQAYRASLDNSWRYVDKTRLSLMRAWATSELGVFRNQPLPVFYPFSGPDFAHVYAFFPHGTVYVLGGLEPVGELPDLTKFTPEAFTALYTEVKTSLATSIAASFFKTNDMKKDFTQAQLNGVVPIIAIFMERSGVDLQQVVPVHLAHDGTVKPSTNHINGVEMVFAQPGQSPQTLYYFQVDVSDDGTKGPSLPRFIANQGVGLTYLKSASYLMHRDGFSVIRSALLKNSQALLEDDSGIPLRFFPAPEWKVSPYGNYISPINLFAERFQPDLRALYDAPPKPKPLPFGIGYKYRKEESMLLWAVKR